MKRAICASLEFFRTKNFLTLETYWSVTLLAGQRIYAPGSGPNQITPITLTSIEGMTLDLDRAGNPNSRWELDFVPNEKMDIFMRGFAYVSQPDFWTWFGQQLYLYPTPDLTGDIVRGRGVIDAGVPLKVFSGSWFFFKPPIGAATDLQAMTDDYPNPSLSGGGAVPESHFWIGDGGYETLKAHVLYSLLQGVWQGRDGAIAAWKALFDERLQALVERHGRAKAARQVEPWRGDWGWFG